MMLTGTLRRIPTPPEGTPGRAQLSDPACQTHKFYDKLLTIDGWQQMRITESAQAVQVSAYPKAYAKHVPAATRLVDRLSLPASCSAEA